MRANSHHRPLLVAAVALQIGVATAAAVGPAQTDISQANTFQFESVTDVRGLNICMVLPYDGTCNASVS
ncbi:hypothetical protein Tco_0562739 [Tanacetum coccineum]